MRLVQLLPVKPQTRARLVHSQHHLSVDFCLDNGLLRLPALQLLPQQLELLIGFAQRRLLREYLVRLGPARTNKQPQLLTACTLEFNSPPLMPFRRHPQHVQHCKCPSCLMAMSSLQLRSAKSQRCSNLWSLFFIPERRLQVCKLLLLAAELHLQLCRSCRMRCRTPQLVAQLSSNKVHQV